MRKLILVPLLAVLTALAVAAPLAGWADDDHKDARRALERGEVRPLEEVIARVRKICADCEFLEVELERDHGRMMYEIKLLSPGGEVRRVKLDPRTLDVMSDRGGRERFQRD